MLAVAGILYLIMTPWELMRLERQAASSFEECLSLGNPVMESYPRQCRDELGNLFVETVENPPELPDVNDNQDAEGGATSTEPEISGSGDYMDKIQVANPEPGQVVASPLTITGEARGVWYFEATFSVILVDWDGRILTETYAEATDDWMTEEYVPFTSTIEFERPYESATSAPEFMKRGALILQKANPSGLPEHDAAIEIPIRFDE